MNITDEARALLTARVARQKGRDDVEVLTVRGIVTDHYGDRFFAEPGIGFTVEFTYTARRHQRRTTVVGWPTCVSVWPGNPNPNLPPALLDLINHAFDVANTERPTVTTTP